MKYKYYFLSFKVLLFGKKLSIIFRRSERTGKGGPVKPGKKSKGSRRKNREFTMPARNDEQQQPSHDDVAGGENAGGDGIGPDKATYQYRSRQTRLRAGIAATSSSSRTAAKPATPSHRTIPTPRRIFLINLLRSIH